MIDILFNKVCKNFGANKVLENISFDIKEKERVALIGTNGCGKTTTLNLIYGKENLTSGTISIRHGASVGILEQIPPLYGEDTKVSDVLNQGIKEILETKERLDQLEKKLTDSTTDLEHVINKYTKTQEKFISMGGYEIDSKIGKVLKVFKISSEMLERDFNTLSGGEKTIISLASLILSEPDILLLDEPTNHLDIETTEWLEEYLKSYKGTILIVSHDRYFLDKVVTETILLERNAVEIFNGNYSYYLKENENRIMNEFKMYKNQQKQIEAMKKSIKQLREWGAKAAPVGEMFYKRAKSIEKRLEQMELLNKPLEKKKLPINFDMDDRSGKIVIDINKLNISYSKVLFNNASTTIYFGEKVCLLGQNGSGKSTLIKEILSRNNDSIRLGSNVSIGYIPQEIRFDNTELTVLQEARKYFVGEEQYLRSALYRFCFYEEDINKKIKVLSGGEKVRLKLFCLIQNNYNLLILDEITNHIDIDTKEILEESLSDYKGTILFISHDRYFVNKLATRVIAIENNKLISYIGNYDDYKMKGN